MYNIHVKIDVRQHFHWHLTYFIINHFYYYLFVEQNLNHNVFSLFNERIACQKVEVSSLIERSRLSKHVNLRKVSLQNRI